MDHPPTSAARLHGPVLSWPTLSLVHWHQPLASEEATVSDRQIKPDLVQFSLAATKMTYENTWCA
jgi:hypothetical protein